MFRTLLVRRKVMRTEAPMSRYNHQLTSLEDIILWSASDAIWLVFSWLQSILSVYNLLKLCHCKFLPVSIKQLKFTFDTKTYKETSSLIHHIDKLFTSTHYSGQHPKQCPIVDLQKLMLMLLCVLLFEIISSTTQHSTNRSCCACHFITGTRGKYYSQLSESSSLNIWDLIVI